MKKYIKTITTVILFAILLSTILCFASCKENSAIEVTVMNSWKADPWMNYFEEHPVPSIVLVNKSDDCTLRFESNDAWELRTPINMSDKKAGDSVNGCVLDISDNCMLINIDSYGEYRYFPNVLYACVSLMRGDKCDGYLIVKISVILLATTENRFITRVCKSEVFDNPQPYSEVQKAFAEYKIPQQ